MGTLLATWQVIDFMGFEAGLGGMSFGSVVFVCRRK